MFVNRLLEWQKAGYVSVNVWTDIKELINITTDSMSSVDDGRLNTDTSNDNPPEPDVDEDKDQQMKPSFLYQRKLQKHDQITEKILNRVSNHIYPSERRQFAIKYLEISEPQYEMIEEDKLYAKDRNFEVNYV